MVLHNRDSKVHGANMGPIWGRQNSGGLHVGPMDFVIWAYLQLFRNDMNGISWQPLSFIQHYLIWSRASWTLEAYMSFHHQLLSQPTVEHSPMIEISAPRTGTHVSYRWQIHYEMSGNIILSIEASICFGAVYIILVSLRFRIMWYY